MSKKGKLFLLPSPLGDDTLFSLSPPVLGTLHRLTFLVVENARTARRFLKTTNPPKPIEAYQIRELNEHTPSKELPLLLQPLMEGNDLGVLSEAGCPGVADPGAALVALAHEKGIVVEPLVGPSSVLLALMASGMNGQQFCFNGYLSPRPAELAADLKRLETLSAKTKQTQLFIETPYRNRQLVEQALRHLQPDTLFCIAVDLTLPTQWIATKRIADWRKFELPDLHKRPAVFLLAAPVIFGKTI
jgi:16S rRNA (cytidine1402-2'-O)-methyltransferase